MKFHSICAAAQSFSCRSRLQSSNFELCLEPLSAVAMPDKKREAAAAKPVEEKPPKAKRGKAEAELVVPAVERPSQPSASPSPSLVPPVLRPELPPDDATESAVPVVTKIMEWAKPLVLKAMLEGKLGHGCSSLEDVPPLEWKDPQPTSTSPSALTTSTSATSTSATSPSTFKETWKPEHASKSLEHRGLYEAGGSLFWVCPVASKETDVQVSWHSVVKGCGVLTVKTMSTGAQRIVWPFTLQC